jgi:hypothetical protein
LENLGREDEGGRGEEEKFMSMVPWREGLG